MPPKRRTGPSYMGVVLWHVRRGGTRLRGVAPLTDGDDIVVDLVYTDGILLWLWPRLGLSSRDDMH